MLIKSCYLFDKLIKHNELGRQTARKWQCGFQMWQQNGNLH